MCLSDLGRVVGVDAARRTATIDVAGRPVEVSTVALGLDAPAVTVGEWLVVHTGLAIDRLDHDAAQEIFMAREQLAPDPGGAPT